MKIYGIKCSEVMVCDGSWAKVAEAEVITDEHETVYVTIQEYEGVDLSVQKGSMYACIVENAKEPADEMFLEEYRGMAFAKESAYADVFAKLRKVMKLVG